MLKTIFNTLINALFPQRCIVCNKLSEEDSFFCKDCQGKIQPIADKICLGCGREQENCDCDRFIYHFDGMIAPFANDGQAKNTFYSFKFGSDFSSVDYFAQNMAYAFKEHFGDIQIDLMCYVPLSEGELYKREFDKCQMLAQKISLLLKIPLENILCKEENVPTQHDLTFDNRFDNVRNAYGTTKKVKGKNILLIDDIKTTGATLDSCARELKFAGAKKVYCLTALSSQKD